MNIKLFTRTTLATIAVSLVSLPLLSRASSAEIAVKGSQKRQ